MAKYARINTAWTNNNQYIHIPQRIFKLEIHFDIKYLLRHCTNWSGPLLHILMQVLYGREPTKENVQNFEKRIMIFSFLKFIIIPFLGIFFKWLKKEYSAWQEFHTGGLRWKVGRLNFQGKAQSQWWWGGSFYKVKHAFQFISKERKEKIISIIYHWLQRQGTSKFVKKKSKLEYFIDWNSSYDSPK